MGGIGYDGKFHTTGTDIHQRIAAGGRQPVGSAERLGRRGGVRHHCAHLTYLEDLLLDQGQKEGRVKSLDDGYAEPFLEFDVDEIADGINREFRRWSRVRQ